MTDTLIKTATHTDRMSRHVNHTSHIRLYPSSPGRMTLQIRSEGKISDHGTKSWRCIGSASVDPLVAKELRDALDAWLRLQVRA